MKLKCVITFLLSAITLVSPFLAVAEGDAEAGKAKAMVCAGCHGTDGNSIMGIWPSLAEQHSSYTYKQLQDFKAGRRMNETMSPMSVPLNDQDMRDLAAFFSKLVIKPSAELADKYSAGGQLYHRGVLDRQITACVGCHGLNGEGNPSLQAPAIGGQHIEYVVSQLKSFRDGLRNNDTGKMMRNIAANMTDEEIDAVSKYVASLNR